MLFLFYKQLDKNDVYFGHFLLLFINYNDIMKKILKGKKENKYGKFNFNNYTSI